MPHNHHHAAMSASSMSNSTTNTLLSSTLQQQQQQQQSSTNNNNMSVYATIKSSSMLRFDGTCHHHHHPYHQVGSGVVEAMQLFDQLIHNKTFLLTFVQVCEQEETASFTLKDKCHFASLLILGLKDNLPYLYSIIKSLLSDYISNCFQQHQSTQNTTKSNLRRGKLLFRSNESLVEPLLTNWLGMFMYDFQRDTQSATHLYRLVKSVKFYLEMGPCDQQTQQAQNTLSEHVLLKETLSYQTIYINIVNQCVSQQSSTTSVQICPLLDCDTVQQAKEKILNFLFKQQQILNKPKPCDVDLELCLILIQNDQIDQEQSTIITLKETEDELLTNSLSQDNQPKRLLTLKDYNIQNGSFINLTYKKQQIAAAGDPQNVYQSMNNEYSLYGGGGSGYNTISRKPLVPLVPPPQIPPQKNRYHLVNTGKQQQELLTFSAASSSSSSSSTSSPSGGEAQSLKKSKSKKQPKKYEKLLTVKSQDSAVTTTTTVDSTASLSHTHILTRLLINKVTLQPFIDQFVECMFTNTANLPPVVQHLFEFFDVEAKKHQHLFVSPSSSKDAQKSSNQAADELHKLTRVWKTNSYFLRYWINLVKNPDNLLSLDSCSSGKNVQVDSTLTCIAQTLLDACSSTDTHNLYDTQSPINRLLFIREVPRYKEMIESFFKEMKSFQPISDHELHFYLNEFSKCQQQQQVTTQQLGFTVNNNSNNNNNNQNGLNDVNSIQVLLQLYEYYEKYEKQINVSLGQQQCSILLPVHHRLVQIKDLMMSQSCNQTFANQHTINRTHLHHTLQQHQQQQQQQGQMFNPYNQYQQPILNKCFPASNDPMPNLSHQYPVHTISANNNNQQQQQKFF
jgi:plexin A